MEKLKMHTPDLAEENYKKLAALFPNAVTETIDDDGNVIRAIDKDVLMQEINTKVVDDGQERYQFTWPDKRKAVILANQPIAKTLRFEKEKSVGKDGTPGGIDSQNIYIEGDNLDALKLLQETYLGKVKMIYIDIWSPSRISPLRSPMVSRCPLPGFQQICSQMSTAWSDGPVDSWEHICYRFPEGATDLKYPYATYHV